MKRTHPWTFICPGTILIARFSILLVTLLFPRRMWRKFACMGDMSDLVLSIILCSLVFFGVVPTEKWQIIFFESPTIVIRFNICAWTNNTPW
jgi:hypothetical protein